MPDKGTRISGRLAAIAAGFALAASLTAVLFERYRAFETNGEVMVERYRGVMPIRASLTPAMDAGFAENLDDRITRLFDLPGKGPRLDHMFTTEHAGASGKTDRLDIESLAWADPDTTGSLPRNDRMALSVNRSGKGAFPQETAPSRKTAELVLRSSFWLDPLDDPRDTSSLGLGLLPQVRKPDVKPSTELLEKQLAVLPVPKPGGQARGGSRFARATSAVKNMSRRKRFARAQRCLATAIYFEARSEPVRGQLAVAQVVMNRVKNKHYPNTVCEVVFQNQQMRNRCQFSFACDGLSDKPRNNKYWARAMKLSRQVTEGGRWLKDIGRATHYHANYVRPKWIRDMRYIKRIGRHIFYRVRAWS